MSTARVQDAVSRGFGRAARAVGDWCEAYRPAGSVDPLHRSNRFLKLQVAFGPADGGFARAVGHGTPLWRGLFDTAYTRPGDYLLRREQRLGAADGGVWFILAQQRLLPVLCARATRVIDVTRPPGPLSGGYGGVSYGAAEPLLSQWPAAVSEAGGGGTGDAGLPGDAAGANWVVLLPNTPGVVLRAGDLVGDDLGRGGVVASAELSDLGWRLRVRLAAA